MDPLAPAAEPIARAADVLRAGGIVAIPTDTLYGLAVDPREADAVARLFALKGRDAAAALPLVAADVAQAARAGALDAVARRLAERWWPGPLTIVVPAAAALARAALAGGTTVAIRVPDHAVPRAVARALEFPVTATSANRSGAASAASAREVASALPQLDLILDAGPTPGGPPSTIVQPARGDLRLIRAGAVPWDRVLESLE
ncbi:MAG TPA: L-threonylcarbamoyladenylate synthase [Vicinamibacterales bacterium]|nr:L-threonylcarbamoyladenylate synthase [Vicinamibacterales bacterium]